MKNFKRGMLNKRHYLVECKFNKSIIIYTVYEEPKKTMQLAPSYLLHFTKLV